MTDQPRRLPKESDLPNVVAQLQYDYAQHIRWAADANTHPALTDAERIAEYRFHYGAAVGLNRALVALGQTYQDAFVDAEEETRKNRAAEKQAIADLYFKSR